MKILIIAPYVTIEGRPEFERNKTGFGYMVMDIAKAIGKHDQVDLLATDTLGESFDYKSVKILKRSMISYLRGVFRCLPLGTLSHLRKNYSMTNGTFIRVVYYWLMSGYLSKLLHDNKYDIVHIHGCSFFTELWMGVCKKCGQRYIVTLHGLNSFSDSVQLEPAGKQYERDFLKRVTNGEISITVISTGIKKLIENTYGVKYCKNITVVCNSFSFDNTQKEGPDEQIRSKYGISEDSKLVVCVGNVDRRKNQGQLIAAFDHLKKELAQQTYILFLGSEQCVDYTIEQLSQKSKWKEHFISCGVVPKEIVANYYQQCNAVALMSLSEGFGLSLIEGMHFGKPSMSFTDVDAYEDIFSPIAMVGVEEHSDSAVAKGLECLLETNWDSDTIKDYSKQFESQSMAEQYIAAFQKEIQSTSSR